VKPVAFTAAVDKVLRANLYSAFVAWKFGAIILFTWVIPQDTDILGQYTLGLGLTASFYIFSGMRSRFLVLRSVRTVSQLKYLTLAITILGAIVTPFVFLMNKDSEILPVVLAVSVAKFLESHLDAGTSYIQNTVGRKRSFSILNQSGAMAALAFTLMLPFGLVFSVLAECAVVVVTILRQWNTIRENSNETPSRLVSGMLDIFREGLAFTIGATLNASLVTYFLFFCSNNFESSETLFVAKLFAFQAILSRLLMGNNIYFSGAFTKLIDSSSARIRMTVLIAGIVMLLGHSTATPFLETSSVNYLVVLGVGFTFVNCLNIAMRQQMLISVGVRRLTALHCVELVILLFTLKFFELSAASALCMFAFMRIIRVLILTSKWFRKSDRRLLNPL